jgi:hypothetical protein
MTVTFLLTGWARESCRESLQLLLTMLPHEMDYPICPCKSLIRATRAFKIRSFLLGMPRGNMKRESLCVKELLLTRLTLKWKMTLVVLHMIMHGVLILLNHLAYRTDIMSFCVFLIRVGHTFIAVSSKNSIFHAAPILSCATTAALCRGLLNHARNTNSRSPSWCQG